MGNISRVTVSDGVEPVGSSGPRLIDTLTGDHMVPVYIEGKLQYFIDTKTMKSHTPDSLLNPRPIQTDAEMYAEWHQQLDNDPIFGWCYFIGGDSGPIKIGYSVDPKSRLRTLQLSSPLMLSIICMTTGGSEREFVYHQQFREHRLHGEWFARYPDILAEIERLQGAA